ncbi:unnamed protein product [Brachionus calyciflorus]|uniref:Major facilitator superfamily (MFS) profile domain-containing protein n=1 Tax=Brachionus calyciflorus TaxID=104777 RepID=A0A814DML5_9BILA|nr:unnamed protein product [Brachionus calyciflorus]
MNFENGLFCDQSNRLLYKINKFKTLLNELDSRSIKSEPIKHDAPIMIPLKYKSNIFLPVTFVLLGLTLLPMQYHLNNFNLQILKMNDSCSDPTALIFNSLSENQTVLFNTLFPYGISNVLRLENFLNELKLLDDLNRKQSLNNITIKYLSQSECLAKNYTKYLNMISVGSEQVNHDKFNSLVKKHLFYQIPYSNIILICDDELYRKSLINMGRMVQPNLDYDIYNDAFAYEIPDYQSNVLVQWNITCANLESSSVTVAYAQMSFLSGKIIGAIFLSILADYVGRKNIYLTTLYASGVVGSLISIVQNYKHFLAIRFLIAALVQGCYIACYVLLFEIIINLKHRNIYCVLFVSLEPFLNTFIGLMTKYVNDWRYLQLVGSLFVSVAFIYPW